MFSFNSASKQFGKTGARCGYAWYPIYDPYAALIFKKFFNFISFSTVAAGTTGLAEFLDLIQAFLDLPDTGKALRLDGNKSLKMRHELVKKELLNRYPGSQVISIPGSPTFFAKIKDPRIPNQRASDVLLKDLDVSVNNGEAMGETKEFIRLNLSGYSQSVAGFLNRLAGQNKYTVQDVFSASADKCNYSIVSSKGLPNTIYIVNPGDCMIDADGGKGPIEVYFPPFIDYEGSRVFTVKKTDTSDNPVVVKARKVTTALKKQGESVKLQWVATFYHQGHWQIVSSTSG
ncbi:MAG: hypothetical protein JSR39_02915 [Verrucomicrobia bacterium]|nr:hypothetical protein [Verrucomicrobiota bacterium]